MTAIKSPAQNRKLVFGWYAYVHTCLLAYIDACIDTYIQDSNTHTYIYIHTYIHFHINTYTRLNGRWGIQNLMGSNLVDPNE